MSPWDAERLANELIDRHHLVGWHFEWNNRKRAFGTCSYRYKRICLSRPMLATQSDAMVRDTILHEIAHALVGPGHGHGLVWKLKAREIGATPRASSNIENPDARPPYKWLVVFGNEVVAGYYRKPKRNMSLCFIPGRRSETFGHLRLVRA